MTRPASPFPLALAATLLLAAACGGDKTATADDAECADGKCDDPRKASERECLRMCNTQDTADPCYIECRDGLATQHCEARRADAIESAQKAFTRDNIRWACSDVAGVDTNDPDNNAAIDSRGQEYCEYYAVVQPPPASEGGALPEAAVLGRTTANETATPAGLSLVDEQIFALEDNPDSVVGACVFTAWHSDVELALPACDGSDVTCPRLAVPDGARLPPWTTARELGDVRLTDTMMRMKQSVNSNAAAADLFEKCMADPPVADPANPDDPLHDDYFRGCWLAYQKFNTEWRRSDPTICAAGVRLAECGCGVDTDADGVADITDVAEVARAVVPPQPAADGTVHLRGFQLGTWSAADQLPAGCRHLATGDVDAPNTLVACDLTASDVLSSQTDVKQKCREKYGDNVVVHIPVPAAAIVCSPPADGPHAATCSAMPWVVQ